MGHISKTVSIALFGVAAIAAPGALAQGVVTIQKLSAALANELVGESVADCAKKNYAVTAVVVGLGVSGAPGGQFDEECGRAALAKIADRMK